MEHIATAFMHEHAKIFLAIVGIFHGHTKTHN